ncbi:MAG: putative Se/S carrier-like protein, partial [Desulfobacterales bacterium]
MLGFFKKKKPTPNKKQRGVSADLGILVFENTSDVIQAENTLKQAGWSVRVMGPPPSIQTGCDLVIEFPLIEELNILRELDNANVSPLKVVPVTAPLLEPVSLFQTKDFGAYLMVRAANMKITIEKKDMKIVNISGGGCPDVPY